MMNRVGETVSDETHTVIRYVLKMGAIICEIIIFIMLGLTSVQGHGDNIDLLTSNITILLLEFTVGVYETTELKSMNPGLEFMSDFWAHWNTGLFLCTLVFMTGTVVASTSNE